MDTVFNWHVISNNWVELWDMIGEKALLALAQLEDSHGKGLHALRDVRKVD